MALLRLIYYTLGVLMFWILVDAVAGWFVHDPNAVPRNITGLLTEPMYRPIRALVRQLYQGPIDISPLVWLLAITAVRRPLFRKIQFDWVSNHRD